MVGLSDALSIIRERLFTFDEFPFVERARLPQGILPKIRSFKEDGFDARVGSLKSGELEALIFEAVEAEDLEDIDLACTVLCRRSSPRIIRLMVSLFQYRYKEAGMKALVNKLKEVCSQGFSREEGFINRFGAEENVALALSDAIKEEGNQIEEFFKEYGINKASPLAKETIIEYFASCEKMGFLLNSDMLTALIEEAEAEEVQKVIDYYLNSLTLIEYIDKVNIAIFKKLGDPYISVSWDYYRGEVKEKFGRWSFLWRLKEHCRGRQDKFSILVVYLEHIRTNYRMDEADALIVDFGHLVLADLKDGDGFFYEKALFEREMKEMEASKEEEDGPIALPTFMRPYTEILTVRKFMLSEEDAPCIRVSFDGINRFYVGEFLDIKLGIEPDMRRLRIS